MENIDKIYYINLDKRIDRKQHIENEFKIMNIPQDKIIRFRAIEHTKGEIGCGLSHINVLEDAIRNNFENIIIFEDDFQFLVTKEELQDILTKLFEIDFNLCMLSYGQLKCVHIDQHFCEVLSAQTASGYVVNKKLFKPLRDSFQEGINGLIYNKPIQTDAIDTHWKNLQGKRKKFLASRKRVGKQIDGFSDIEGIKCVRTV